MRRRNNAKNNGKQRGSQKLLGGITGRGFMPGISGNPKGPDGKVERED